MLTLFGQQTREFHEIVHFFSAKNCVLHSNFLNRLRSLQHSLAGVGVRFTSSSEAQTDPSIYYLNLKLTI